MLSKNNPNTYSFDELVALLLQEEQSRANKDSILSFDQAFVAPYKGKGQFGASSAKPKSKAHAHVDQSKPKEEKVDKKKRCNYCRKVGHLIAECTKRIENEKKRKQQGLVASTDNGKEEANLAHDGYALTATCMDYESSSTCFSISNVDWYFDSGATKHITSCKTLFSTLRDAPRGGSVLCANDASYAIKGIGDVELISCSGDTFTLVDALYIPSIVRTLFMSQH